jgi:hypothetical protein
MIRTLDFSEHKLFKILGVFGLCIALGVDFFRGFEYVILQADGRNDYVTQAEEMLRGWSYMVTNPNPLGHGIGFSLLIALTFLISNSTSFVILKILFAVCHGTSAYLLARIGFELGLKKPFWIAASIFYAIDPFILFAASDVTTEPIITLFVLYWAFLFLRVMKNGKIDYLHILLFGLSGFYSAFARPNSILPFIVIAFFMFYKWGKEGISRLVLSLSAMIFASLLLMYEVILTKLYAGFVFLSPAGGYNAEVMCSKVFVPQYLGFISQAENTRINNWVYGATKSGEIFANQEVYNIPAANQELWKLGIKSCLAQPLESLGVLLIKPFALWRPYVVYGAYSPTVFFASLLLWVPLTIAAIYFLTRRNLNPIQSQLRNYFLIMAISFTISLELTPTQIRHRVAFAEPFYWLFFVWVVAHVSQKIKRKNKNLQNK